MSSEEKRYELLQKVMEILTEGSRGINWQDLLAGDSSIKEGQKWKMVIVDDEFSHGFGFKLENERIQILPTDDIFPVTVKIQLNDFLSAVKGDKSIDDLFLEKKVEITMKDVEK